MQKTHPHRLAANSAHLLALLLVVGSVVLLQQPTAADAAAFASVETLPGVGYMTDAVDNAILRRAMRQGNDCDAQEEIRDLCQRCAKVTRSTVAYPLCCQPRDSPRIWCMKFLAFGIRN